MTLGEYIKLLEKHDPKKTVKKGLSNIDSWRGSYDECSLEIVEDITVGEMLKNAKDFLEKGCMSGYKGGVYPVNENTDINIDSWGHWSDGRAMWGLLLELMLGDD